MQCMLTEREGAKRTNAQNSSAKKRRMDVMDKGSESVYESDNGWREEGGLKIKE